MDDFLGDIKSYIGLTEADAHLLAAVGPSLEPYFPTLADLFYNKILEHPEAARVFTGPEQLGRLRLTLQHWARGLFGGRYEGEYAADRMEIGRRHVRAGVPQKYVISAMDVVRIYLLETIDQVTHDVARAARTKRAVNKILDLDLNLMCESYFETSVRELRELNARLEAANLELAELSRVKDEFLAHTSHELRTPLNSILGFTKLILDGMCQGPEEERELLRDVFESGQHLLGIVNDVLDIARIEAGKLRLSMGRVELRPLLEQVLTVVSVQADAKGLKIVDETAEILLPAVRADENRLRQILINLLGNAVKFTDEGWVSLRARTNQVAGHVLIEVQDTGVGIPLEKQAHVFEKFKQVDTSFTRRHGGSGLGLSISRRLVEMMGGYIELESAGAGLGTTVRFTLPIDVPVEDRPHRAEYDTLPIAGRREGVRVLVVDNDPGFRKYVKHILAREGFAVVTAGTFADALDAAERFHPAVALVDWVLPVSPTLAYGNGVDLIANLQQRFGLPTILVTGHASSRAEAELARREIKPLPPILQKPLNGQDLTATVQRVLNTLAPQT
jgi:signal transduction histidine kinase/ActR/RegA family two-component response regulator